MATGQCLQFIVLDVAFIVRELQVRIPAHHSSFLDPTHLQYSTPKERKQTGPSDSTPGERPKACLPGSILAPMHNAMQPRSSDRVWEPPAARAPVPTALSWVRPIVVIDLKGKKGQCESAFSLRLVCVTVARIQRHGPRVSDVSLLVALLSASPHVFAGLLCVAVGSRIGAKRDAAWYTPEPHLIGLRDAQQVAHKGGETRI